MSVVMGVMQLEEEESEDGCERQRAPMVTNVDFRKEGIQHSHGMRTN